MINNLVSAKVSVFQQDQINFHPNLPKGLAWHKHLSKHKKHNHKSRIILLTHKDRKQKAKINFIHWVASQQALSFYAPS